MGSPTGPKSPSRLLNEALRFHRAGKLKEAEGIYRQILKKHPGQPDALHLMGVIAHQIGQQDVAVNLIREAIKANPIEASFHNNIAEAYKAQGKLDEAKLHYEKAITLNGDYFEAYNNLGAILQETGRITDALAYYEKALSLNPGYAEAHNNIAVALKELGNLDEALAHCREAIHLRQDYAEAYNNMGIILNKKSLIDEAIDSYKKAIELKEEYAEAYNNLAVAVKEKGEYQKEIDLYKKALSINPGYAAAYYNLGSALQEHGYIDEALEAYGKAYNLKPQDSIKIKAALVLPVIPGSAEEIVEFRIRFAEHLTDLIETNITLTQPEVEIETTSFYLAYQGFNDRDIQVKLAQLYVNACPALTYTAPYCVPGRIKKPEGRIRIGFVSKFFRDHTVGRYMTGIIKHLSRQTFEVLLFSFPGKSDSVSEAIESGADKVITLPLSLDAARRRIEEEQPDLLFYPDIGMESFTYFLAFSRLAPVQYAFYGHPDTTGIANIDYFISHEDCELSGCEAHYSEKLLKLTGNVVYTYFYRHLLTGAPKERDTFGLDRPNHIYICPQSLFKIHPEFDAAIGAILRKDPQGIVILFQGKSPRWAQLLTTRFQKTIPDVTERIILAPRMAYNDYLNLVSVSDVMLDTFHFSGGNSTFDGFAMGTPIVTLPGQFMRGRQTFSLYKRMGIMDCVAGSIDEYIHIAGRLATDSAYRNGIKERILAANHLIFEDIGMVRELETLLQASISG
jgi:protein O-GlcNAc transferase